MEDITMKRKALSAVVALALALFAFAGCDKKDAQETSVDASSEPLKAIVDLVPHSEIIEYVKPKLEAKGVYVDVVSTASDSTTNEKTLNGEVDFNYFQHEPYLKLWNSENSGNLVNVADIHVEPITAYSDKYSSKDEIKAGDTVAIPNDPSNEYRALAILEQAGFLTLDDAAKDAKRADVSNIAEKKVDLTIIELDSIQIIPTKDDYDFFITNTNKALEAGITSARLFSEGADSPYANIIATRPELKDDDRVKALIAELTSKETQDWIQNKYNGAVIPFAKGDSSAAQSDAPVSHEVSYPSETDPAAATNFKYGKIQIPGKGGALCGAPVYIAYEKGFFAAEGFDVELISADTETRKIGLNNGTIPVVNGDFQFFQSIENGVNVSVVEGLHKGCIKFLVKADSDIYTVDDLKGKKIGIDEVGGTPHQVAAVWLEKAVISADQAKREVTFLPFEEGNLEVEALRSGDVDVAALWDPFASIQEKSGDFRVIFDLATDPLFADHYCCFLYASNKWIDEKPEQVAALLRAYRSAQDWIANNVEEAVNIIDEKKYSSIDDKREVAVELLEHYAIPELHDHGTAAYDVGGDVKYFAEQLHSIGYLETAPEEFVKQAYAEIDLTLGQ
jgi:NitT/TauT family transport system substrate-binding protein